MDEIDQNMDELGSDSGVVKALRAQIRDLERELKTRPAADTLEAEIRSKLAREDAAASLLIERGQPARLAKYMLQEIEGDVDGSAVDSFLQGLGLDAKPASVEGSGSAEGASALAEVTSLASQVSTAAAGTPADNLFDKIAGARNQEELNALMAEAGLVQDSIQ